MRITFFDDRVDARNLIDPAFHERKVLDGFRIEQRLHRAALRVSADDDVLHAEHAHGELDCGCRRARQVRMRHDVADVLHAEHVAGLRVRDQMRNGRASPGT